MFVNTRYSHYLFIFNNTAIHGNQNVNITIRDIVFTDFEVVSLLENQF